MNAGAEGLLLEAANSFILTVGEGRSRIPSPYAVSPCRTHEVRIPVWLPCGSALGEWELGQAINTVTGTRLWALACLEDG